MFVKQCSIHRSRAKYIWKKKTNKLPVHPYKPVSWSPTHQIMAHIRGLGNQSKSWKIIILS